MLNILMPKCIGSTNDVFLNILKNVVAHTKVLNSEPIMAFRSGMMEEEFYVQDTTLCLKDPRTKEEQILQSKLLGFWCLINCPTFCKVFFGQSWKIPKGNIIRVRSEKGEKVIKADEINSILIFKMTCCILKLDVSSSTVGKLKHFVGIPSNEVDLFTYNEIGITAKIKSFDIHEEQLQKCWMALKCGEWDKNDVINISLTSSQSTIMELSDIASSNAKRARLSSDTDSLDLSHWTSLSNADYPVNLCTNQSTTSSCTLDQTIAESGYDRELNSTGPMSKSSVVNVARNDVNRGSIEDPKPLDSSVNLCTKRALQTTLENNYDQGLNGAGLLSKRSVESDGVIRGKWSAVGAEVPKAQHRYIAIDEILQLTGVIVEMPFTSSTNDAIVLRGPQEKLASALSMVYVNCVCSDEIDAPEWIHKYVVGHKRANIKKLQMEYPQVHIEFIENKIKTEGPPEQVEKAGKQLVGFVRDCVKRFTFESIAVNPIYCKHVVGNNVNRFKEELDVTVAQERDTQNRIRIEGPAVGVRKAVEKLRDQIDALENYAIIDRSLLEELNGVKSDLCRKCQELEDTQNKLVGSIESSKLLTAQKSELQTENEKLKTSLLECSARHNIDIQQKLSELEIESQSKTDLLEKERDAELSGVKNDLRQKCKELEDTQKKLVGSIESSKLLTAQKSELQTENEKLKTSLLECSARHNIDIQQKLSELEIESQSKTDLLEKERDAELSGVKNDLRQKCKELEDTQKKLVGSIESSKLLTAQKSELQTENEKLKTSLLEWSARQNTVIQQKLSEMEIESQSKTDLSEKEHDADNDDPDDLNRKQLLSQITVQHEATVQKELSKLDVGSTKERYVDELNGANNCEQGTEAENLENAFRTDDVIVRACRGILLKLPFGWIKFTEGSRYYPGFVHPIDTDGLTRAQDITTDGYVADKRSKFFEFNTNLPEKRKGKTELNSLAKFNRKFGTSFK